MLSVRLNKDIEKALDRYSTSKRISKSAVVKKALELFFKKEKSTQTPYELGADLFGKTGSGKKDLSTTYKKQVKQKLRAKHSY